MDSKKRKPRLHLPNAITHLTGCLSFWGGLEPEWKPDVVAISGDLGWKGSEQDYDQAKQFITHLLYTTGLSFDDLVVCAGNHDVDRHSSIRFYPSEAQDADERLSVENPAIHTYLAAPFKSFVAFCSELGIPHLSLGEGTYRLMGQREVEGLNLRLLVLNSAWFSHSEADEGKLWIGLPQLEVMNSKSQLVEPTDYDEDRITVAVLHHPPSWLHAAENNDYGGRPDTYSYLSHRCHIILSGHEHSRPRVPSQPYIGGAYLFRGGATYAGNRYSNSFSILQLDMQRRTLTQRAFEFDPGPQHWTERRDLHKEYSLQRDSRLLAKREHFAETEVILESSVRKLFDEDSTLQAVELMRYDRGICFSGDTQPSVIGAEWHSWGLETLDGGAVRLPATAQQFTYACPKRGTA
jgi:hypothetical protein